MAERGTSFWQPPDFDPKKHKSINAYHGVHALRERARKIHQGIIIIRFEMPFNIWCNGCNNHIGMGVRYNAEKTKTGKYYSTTIYKFRMKCHLCDNHFEVQTDPKNLDYEILSGARRQERRWDPTKNEQVVPEEKATSQKLASDPMFSLEHQAEDVKKREEMKPVIQQIQQIQQRMKDDFASNQLLRRQFREKKKEMKEAEAQDMKLLEKSSLSMKLVPENEKDIKLARLLRLQATESTEEAKKRKRKEILSESVFPKLSCTINSGSINSGSINSGLINSGLINSGLINSGSINSGLKKEPNSPRKKSALDHLVRTLRSGSRSGASSSISSSKSSSKSSSGSNLRKRDSLGLRIKEKDK